MQDLNDLYFYVQAVDHGGFAPASRALGIPKSKLSRRIALLEERLGVRLIQRTTRRFEVTEIGRTYYEHCKAMLVEAESAQEAIDAVRAEPSGTVRLSCPTALLEYRIGPLLGAFMVEHPRVQVVVEATNRRIDVVGEKLDLALRVRFPPLEDSGLVMRTLVESPQRLVASPACLRGRAPLHHPDDLQGLPSLDWGPPRDHSWCLDGPPGQTAEVRHRPRYITDDMTALRQAALQGVGIVQLPHMVVDKDLEAGRLIDILPQWAPRSGIVHAVFPSRRGQLPAVRALIDYLVAHIWT
ncbi:MAG: putative transcription regulator protein [Moraxellaceae bacterium]|jgi:DNA-binding transcriptional LysR family regulator|nr:putative transcription regulator protein [Moraxellaceae bacterium]